MSNRQYKILIVDDLPDWRLTLGGLLTDAGYDVCTTDSLVGALELFQDNQFDLAILDMRLDESDEDNIDGLDLAAKIREQWPGVKVIIITGYGTQERLDQALKPDAEGHKLAVDFIPKTEAEKLVQIVQEVLA